ncbi:CUE domain-containing protein 1 [Ixodes scapularis]|nr:CUE domain-containing protein 1 [Ixodes scapularis]
MTTQLPAGDVKSPPSPRRQQQQQPQPHLAAPRGTPKHSRPPVTQLEFRQAMRDFRSMFPEMEAGVIEAVLRANGGAVDATIDQLLAMATDNDNERLRTELEATENAEAPPHYSPPGGPTPPPSYQQATRPMHSHRGEEQPQPQPPPTSHRSQWKPPLLGPLPPTFLRLTPSPGPSQGELSSAVLQQRMEENARQQRRLAQEGGPCGDLARFLEDERMAILLQNQEFVRQLRGNRDFMTTLHRDIQDQEMEQSAGLVPDDGSQDGSDEVDPWAHHAGGPDSEEADAAFKERLKSMGKASRRKFAQLARLFSRTKKCHFRQMLGEGPNPSRDNLLLHEDSCPEEGRAEPVPQGSPPSPQWGTQERRPTPDH